MPSNGIERTQDADGRFQYFWKENAAQNTFLSVPNNVLKKNFNGEFTISFWTQDENMRDLDTTVYARRLISGGELLIQIGGVSSNDYMFSLTQGWPVPRLHSSTNVVNGQKTHWTFTRDSVRLTAGDSPTSGMTLRLYKNGLLIQQSSEPSSASPVITIDTEFVIGYIDDYSHFFKNKALQDFRIYNLNVNPSLIPSLVTYPDTCKTGESDGVSCPGLCLVPEGFQITSSGANLEPCPINTYNDGNSLACTPCPPGTYTARGELTAEAECECISGYERVAGVCSACSVGSYKAAAGDGPCYRRLVRGGVCDRIDWEREGLYSVCRGHVQANHREYGVFCLPCADHGIATGICFGQRMHVPRGLPRQLRHRVRVREQSGRAFGGHIK